jgi:protein PhnA
LCPACGFEWEAKDAEESEGSVVKDANGNILTDGDTVEVVKDFPVKGVAKATKAGTKGKHIRLVEGDHNIDSKLEGLGPMALKSEFVRKG